MNFSAVILAGGKSSRMGRDKAFLEIAGISLLARQIETVRAAGAAEVFISGRLGVDYSAFNCDLLLDQFPDAGPLAGIAVALAVAAHPMVLVLAVDLPAVNAEFLRRLRTGCTESVGTIPRVDGYLEPLVAFYPKAAHVVAEKMLAAHNFAVKDFACGCVRSGLGVFEDLPAADSANFKNCNSPSDLPCLI